jgi:hypothetical protein
MTRSRTVSTLPAVFALMLGGMILSRADETGSKDGQLPVADAECTAFGAGRERTMRRVRRGADGVPVTESMLSAMTEQVTSALGAQALNRSPYTTDAAASAAAAPGSIDSFLYADMQANGIQPADKTTDWEFIRRVTLDLTGRIPKPERVLSFVADKTSDKRASLVDELLASPEWVDKWTMYFGDLYKNTDNRPSTALRRFPQGRNAFYKWIHDSLAANKPYSQMATELISTQGSNSYQQGELNWMLNGFITGGPVQDVTDSAAANVAETFLGISHMNCVLCHNGRGHLDSLSLWGASTTRAQAWQFASFLAHTTLSRTQYDPNNRNVYYWAVLDNAPRDYTLGSTNGNRPARAPLPSCPPKQPCYVSPVYFFTGNQPGSGENYRVSLARLVTSDVQFARAAVNYIWAQLFGRGIVDPPNQFDPARLDPDNPPPDPWTLQPSNARLLNTLAARFVDNGYDLKALMREITTSDAYQLSSRYTGQWNPSAEKFFARKFVRRLWAEEIHDAIVQSSGVLPKYNIPNFSDQGFTQVTWAMQFPDVTGMPTPRGTLTTFLDSFLRGNRDDGDRRGEGSVLQALNLMNDPFVAAALQPGGNNANQLLAQNLSKPDDQLVKALYLGVLSRYPSDSELTAAMASLKGVNKAYAAQNLLWSLYNKVDFIFNY